MKVKLFLITATALIILVASIKLLEGPEMARSLKTYKKKRDFSKTAEPEAKKIKKSKNRIFVIQKHEASRLHYDFRLEIDGVLVSWAVPKGPSLNPADKRLAVMTEDHPMAYRNFEGIIPKGQYGGGTVMIWDYGTYKNIREKDGKIVPMEQCLKDGKIDIELKGKKLDGAFSLIQIRGKDSKNWLLIKENDEFASKVKNPVNTKTKSAKTDKTMTQIAKDGEKYSG